MSAKIDCDKCGVELDGRQDMTEHLRDEHNVDKAEARKLYLEMSPDNQASDEGSESENEGGGATGTDSDDGIVIEHVDADATTAQGGSVDADAVTPNASSDSAKGSSDDTRDRRRQSDSGVGGTDGRSGPAAGGGTSLNGPLDNPGANQAKWFLFGVGGCGGNLIDSIILRYETLGDDNSDLAEGWERAVRGLTAVNSNTNRELHQTYYAREYREKTAQNVVNELGIGPDSMQGGGAYWKEGEEMTEWTFAQSEGKFADNYWGSSTDYRRILDTQAVLFLHSSVKGTGTGATPVVARELDEAEGEPDFDWDMVNPKVTKFSLSVLPSGGCGDLEKTNGLVGFANLAREMDAIIPVDNKNLGNAPDSVGVGINGTEGYQAHTHRKENSILVSFLETFTFASVGGGAESVIQGEGFDPQDAFVPAKTMISHDTASGDEPAIVMAPAYGKTKTGSDGFTPDELHNLMTNALTEGKLVDFDHTTAWGGVFVFEAPMEYDERVRTVCERNFDDIVQKSEHLDIDPHSEQDMRATPHRRQFVFRRDIDDVRLWVLLYNPQMSRLERWRNWADEHRGGPERYQRHLKKQWDRIEEVFSRLGRQNRPSS